MHPHGVPLGVRDRRENNAWRTEKKCTAAAGSIGVRGLAGWLRRLSGYPGYGYGGYYGGPYYAGPTVAIGGGWGWGWHGGGGGDWHGGGGDWHR